MVSKVEVACREQQVLSLNLGEESLVLYRMNEQVDGELTLPCEDKYHIEFDTDSRGSISELTLPGALIVVINVLCGVGERATHQAGEYGFNKEQLLAMASMYSQSDSQDLLDVMHQINDVEIASMRSALSTNKV